MQKNIFKDANLIFSLDDRIIKAAEECGEFLQAYSKFRENQNSETAENLYVEICDLKMALKQSELRVDEFVSEETKHFIREHQHLKLRQALKIVSRP